MSKSENDNLNCRQGANLSTALTERFVEVVNSLPRKKEAARIAGCSQHQLLRYRRGTRIPFEVIGRLCDESGHSIDWVWRGEVPKYREHIVDHSNNEVDFKLITKCMAVLEEIVDRNGQFKPNQAEKATIVGMLYNTYIENIHENKVESDTNNIDLLSSLLARANTPTTPTVKVTYASTEELTSAKEMAKKPASKQKG